MHCRDLRICYVVLYGQWSSNEKRIEGVRVYERRHMVVMRSVCWPSSTQGVEAQINSRYWIPDFGLISYAKINAPND